MNRLLNNKIRFQFCLNPIVVAVAVALTCTTLTGCWSSKPQTDVPDVAELTGTEKVIADLILSEDLVLDLTPRLNELAKWFQEDSAGNSKSIASDLATCESVIGLADVDPRDKFHSDSAEPMFLEVFHWPSSELASSKINPWESSKKLDVVWETMKFGVVSANFTSADQTEFAMHTKVEARGASKADRQPFGMKAHQEILFQKSGEDWKLKKWIQEDFFVERTSKSLFREVLAKVIRDPDSLSKATRSYKDEIIVKAAKQGGIVLPVPELVDWTSLSSNHIFPSVSVVDYNNDGLDDLFLTARWGPTQMLKNLGDGTFEDVAKEIGLFEPYMVNCVLFVDTDNDGDKDAIMGRPMETVKYLRNDNGKFVDITRSHSDIGKQYFTSGFAATDVNRDGLIDIYVSNYPPLGKEKASFENSFLSEEERALFLEKRAKGDRWLDLAGSANVLLMNRGDGRLERVPYDELLSQWHRSFQAVWADIDNDGDDDLYVANDFAPDSLLRNDTPRGAEQPVFAEVIQDKMIGGAQGSAMGGSWGDFDQDGDLDLYVSNMFSKAGNRIIAQVGEVDPRVKASAAGNFLFENQGETYLQRAGPDTDQFHVDRVGWSYGGQWADFNNDGKLDLYVPSGFYTAPEEIDAEVDT